MPILIGASLLLLLLSLDGRLGLLDGRMFFALLLAYTGFLIVQSRRETRAAQDAHAAPNDYEAELQPAAQGAWDSRLWVQLLLIVAGSDWLVTASVVFAKTLGVSDVVIGLTIVAAGTSMPEVATSLAAAFKGERDIAVGNAVGSSTLKILGCLGLPGAVGAASGQRGPHGAQLGAGVRHMGDAGGGPGQPAHLPVGTRDRPLGSGRVPGLLRSLLHLHHHVGAGARSAAHLLRGDDGVCDSAHGDHARGVADSAQQSSQALIGFTEGSTFFALRRWGLGSPAYTGRASTKTLRRRG